jgi:hypothetical protein
VANHPRPLPDAARAVHETPPDRAHGAGVEMVDAHCENLLLKTGALLAITQSIGKILLSDIIYRT